MDEGDHSDEDPMEEDIDLEEIIKALREDEDAVEAEVEAEGEEDELEEAYSVIKYLRSKLNEVNLLNAKLLYVNKLFKKAELNESKKIKIIETFDRVKSVREAKLVYATLAESVMTAPVKQTKKTPRKPSKKLTEGYASAPSKGTKKVINESNEVYDRLKTLMNYNE